MKKGGLLIILLLFLLTTWAQKERGFCLVIHEAEHPRLFLALASGRYAIAESFASYEKWESSCFRYVIDSLTVDIIIHRPMHNHSQYVHNEGWAVVKTWGKNYPDEVGELKDRRCPPPSLARLEKFFLTPPRL